MQSVAVFLVPCTGIHLQLIFTMKTIPSLVLVGVAILMLMGLTACSAPPARVPATLIHEDVHTGGNLVRFDAAQTHLASAGWEGRVVLWSLPDGQRKQAWQAHEGTVNGLVFLSSGNILTAGYDGVLAEWALDGTLSRRFQTPSPVRAMVVSEELGQIVTGHQDGVLRRWAFDSWAPLVSVPLRGHPVKALSLRASDGAMAASDLAGNVILMRADGTTQALPPGPTDTWTLDFSPDGSTLMGAGWFRLHRWRLPEGELTTLPTEHRGIIKSLHYSADGAYLVTISRQTDSAVNLLDPETGVVQRRFQKHALCGGDVRLSDDGRFLASTSDDASVRLWDLRSTSESQ